MVPLGINTKIDSTVGVSLARMAMSPITAPLGRVTAVCFSGGTSTQDVDLGRQAGVGRRVNQEQVVAALVSVMDFSYSTNL